MFSYYGSKSKIVDYYPPPKHKKIIEPFAGSARYSLKYWQNDVLLVDKYEVIVKLWKYLQTASPKDILNLPDSIKGQDIRTLGLSAEEKSLMGFCIGRGNLYPLNFAGDFCNWNDDKKRIANNLYKIKHWTIKQGCYTELENIEATWFIDPPYMVGGHIYKHSNIDFTYLAEWCKTRNGQAIVCENTKATWLPFKPMTEMEGAQTRTTEAIWSNLQTNYDAVQTKIF